MQRVPNNSPSSLHSLLPFSIPPSLPLEKSQSKPPQNQVERVKVMFDYTAEQPDELSVEVGDVLEVVSKEVDDQEGWWEVGSVSLYLCLCVCLCVCVHAWVVWWDVIVCARV